MNQNMDVSRGMSTWLACVDTSTEQSISNRPVVGKPFDKKCALLYLLFEEKKIEKDVVVVVACGLCG